MKAKPSGSRASTAKFLLVALVLALTVWLMPIPGLAPKAAEALALLVAASVLWLTGVGSMGTVSLGVIALIIVLGVAPADVAFAGFVNDVTWLVTGAFFIARAVSKVGLDKRIAYSFMKVSSGSYFWLTFAIWMAAAVLGVAIPSAIVRMAVFLPVAQGLMALLEARPGTKLAANLEWTVFYACGGAAIFSLPSIIPMMVSVGVLANQYGLAVSYAQFAALNAVPTVIFILIMWLSIHLVFRPEKGATARLNKEFIAKEYEALGKVRPEEWKVLAWLIVTVGAWVVGGYTGLPTGAMALLSGALLFTPGVGVLEVADLKRINLDMALFIGAILGISPVMVYTGLAGFIGNTVISPVLGLFTGALGAYIGYGIGTGLFFVLANFVLPSTIPLIGVFGPPLLAFAQATGVNLTFATLTNGMDWLLSGFFPYQLVPLVMIWPLGGVRTFRECAKHSSLLFLPKLLVLVLIMLSWMTTLGVAHW